MKKLLAVVALFVLGCQDYESPGAVADESLWSHVPAGAGDPPPTERQQRQQAVAALEERVANLEYRLSRLKSAASAQPGQPAKLDTLNNASGRLDGVKEDVRSLRQLYDEPAPFRDLRERAELHLDEIDSRLQNLALPEDESAR